VGRAGPRLPAGLRRGTARVKTPISLTGFDPLRTFPPDFCTA
jgi:hypothetical protein